MNSYVRTKRPNPRRKRIGFDVGKIEGEQGADSRIARRCVFWHIDLMTKRKLQRNIEQVLDQIVSLANPSRVILFGSAAKGDITPDSDLDFLVVIPNSRNREDVVDCLNKGVRQKAMPCDFLVVTAAVLSRTKANAGLIYGEILKTGREIYAA